MNRNKDGQQILGNSLFFLVTVSETSFYYQCSKEMGLFQQLFLKWPFPFLFFFGLKNICQFPAVPSLVSLTFLLFKYCKLPVLKAGNVFRFLLRKLLWILCLNVKKDWVVDCTVTWRFYSLHWCQTSTVHLHRPHTKCNCTSARIYT